MLSHATADSAWLLKQLVNVSSRHRAFEADRGKHAYLHSGLQAGLQAYPRQWASNREGGTSLYLSRQIVHNTVGSLPLAKNALHSLTSILCIFCWNAHAIIITSCFSINWRAKRANLVVQTGGFSVYPTGSAHTVIRGS